MENSKFPLLIWAQKEEVSTNKIEIVSRNLKNVLKAFQVPVDDVLYERTVGNEKFMHLFYGVDENSTLVRIQSGLLANLTGQINVKSLTKYSTISGDILCAMIPKAERINIYPPLFGFDETIVEFGRSFDLEKLRQEGHFAIQLNPVAGIDYRITLMKELAELWGIEFIRASDPDILVFRTSNKEFEGTWLKKNFQRIIEDKLPVINLEGAWMLLSDTSAVTRTRLLLAVLEFFRKRNLSYITSATYHCYVHKNLSISCALGSVKDMTMLTEYLEDVVRNGFEGIECRKINDGATNEEIVNQIYRKNTDSRRAIAVKDGDEWYMGYIQGFDMNEQLNIKEELLNYYRQSCQPGLENELNNLSIDDLLKVVKVQDCPQSKHVTCITPLSSKDTLKFQSHRAYQQAVQNEKLKVRKTYGIFKLGPFDSPFFPSYSSIMDPPTRYGLRMAKISFVKEAEEPEEFLLKKIVGQIWLFSIYDKGSDQEAPTKYDVIQIATDREPEAVKDVCFHAWKSGFLMGNWSKVLLTYKDKVSISVNGGTIDPYIAQASDSIVDGNRWLDMIKRTMKDCQ